MPSGAWGRFIKGGIMVKINGKEYGMSYNVRARIESSNWLAANTETASVDEFRLVRAVAMINAYNKAHNIDEKVTVEDFYDLPNREFEQLLKAEEIQYNADTRVEVEAVPKKGKNAKSTAVSS